MVLTGYRPSYGRVRRVSVSPVTPPWRRCRRGGEHDGIAFTVVDWFDGGDRHATSRVMLWVPIRYELINVVKPFEVGLRPSRKIMR
jgi:hypothetical protein